MQYCAPEGACCAGLQSSRLGRPQRQRGMVHMVDHDHGCHSRGVRSALKLCFAAAALKGGVRAVCCCTPVHTRGFEGCRVPHLVLQWKLPSH